MYRWFLKNKETHRHKLDRRRGPQRAPRAHRRAAGGRTYDATSRRRGPAHGPCTYRAAAAAAVDGAARVRPAAVQASAPPTLHRHFELKPNERLVDYGGTSVPWRLGKISRNIQPCNWALNDDVIRPYEFRYSCGPDAGPDFAEPALQAFAIEFRELMHRRGAQELFGLCSYPGDDFTGRVEVTEGRANINLKPEDVSSSTRRYRPCH